MTSHITSELRNRGRGAEPSYEPLSLRAAWYQGYDVTYN